VPLPETPAQASLRTLAASLALIAGAVHLGQIGAHLVEGWPIAGFFIVVGVIQVGAAVLLLRPRARPWFWLGIAGSAAVIAVWVVSRTLGLPFVEGGAAEPVGVADGVASLTEAWTIVVLGVYLAEPTPRWQLAAHGLGTVLAVGLAGLWWVAADAGVFNSDPARLAVDHPWLVDWLVVSAGIGLAAALLPAIRAPLPMAWRRGLWRGLAAATTAAGLALVGLTLPPTIGQNLDCRYAPVSAVLSGSHAETAEAIALDVGERRFLPAFELHACGRAEVTLERVEPATTIGHGGTAEGFWLLPSGSRIPEEGAAALPSGARAVPPGDRIVPGQPRQLVVRLTATGDGEFTLGSLRLTYRTTATGTFTFATQITACTGACDRE